MLSRRPAVPTSHRPRASRAACTASRCACALQPRPAYVTRLGAAMAAGQGCASAPPYQGGAVSTEDAPGKGCVSGADQTASRAPGPSAHSLRAAAQEPARPPRRPSGAGRAPPPRTPIGSGARHAPSRRSHWPSGAAGCGSCRGRRQQRAAGGRRRSRCLPVHPSGHAPRPPPPPLQMKCEHCTRKVGCALPGPRPEGRSAGGRGQEWVQPRSRQAAAGSEVAAAPRPARAALSSGRAGGRRRGAGGPRPGGAAARASASASPRRLRDRCGQTWSVSPR